MQMLTIIKNCFLKIYQMNTRHTWHNASLIERYIFFQAKVPIGDGVQMHVNFQMLFVSHAGDRGSAPSQDRLKSLKQVVTALLPNSRQQVWVSWALRYHH